MRSKYRLALISICICLMQWQVVALELTPESKLRKLSYQLRGFPPSPAEFTELAKNTGNSSDLSTFFSKKIEEYYKSPWTGSKLAERLLEDWRLDNAGDDLNTNASTKPEDYTPEYATPTSGDMTLKSIRSSFTNGDSWDQILISNSFKKTFQVIYSLNEFKTTYDYYGASRIQNFKKKVLDSGKKLDTEEDIIAAIDDFEKENANLDLTQRAALMQGSTPMPYLRNSHLDKKLTVLILQDALNPNSAKYSLLVNHFMQIKDLTSYQSKILSSAYVQAYTPGDTASISNKELPQLIFSQSKLSDRYKKTIYSKAAAFFRIYLCDDMQQIALPSPGSKSQTVFKMIHNPESGNGAPPAPPMSISPVDKAKQHVQPQCLGCHSKLDPMESIFNKKFQRLTPGDSNPAPFNFVYDDFNGKQVTITVANIDELPEVISKQPQYIRCQSEKFWNWYIGSDVPISPKQRAELENVYVQTKSKPLELIKYLINLNIYTSDAFLSEPRQFNNVRPIFQKCHGCHKSDPTIPSLLETPFNLNRATQEEKMADHFEILKNVVKLTNILGDQKGIKMPTKDAGWKISEAERKTLIKWIADGAKDENGVNTITEEQKNKILAPAKAELMETINQPSQLVPTLRSTWQRILTYSEILKTIPLKIPTIASSSTSSYSYSNSGNSCFSDIINKKYVLGHIDLYTALPVSDQPDNAYREIYRKCIVKLLNQSKSTASSYATMALSGPTALTNALYVQQLKSAGLFSLASAMGQSASSGQSNLFLAISQLKWAALTDEQKLTIIREQIQFILGPKQNHIVAEMSLDQYILKAVNKLAEKDTTMDVISASYFSLYYIFNSNSFLVY